jgi:diguanylate cyclase (GGDEF)-like protein/PAS domain S-box-containing protein
MGLQNKSPQSTINKDLIQWRRNTLNLLYRISIICSSIEIILLGIFVKKNLEYFSSVAAFGIIYFGLVIFAFINKIPYKIRAIGLVVFIYGAGAIDLFSTGISGDGRIFLIAAPVVALLLSGTTACTITTGVSLVTFMFAGLASSIEGVPVRFIPQELFVQPITWLSSGLLFGTILIGLVTLVWQFARLNNWTSAQNNQLVSEGKTLREVARSLQNREAELQALLNSIGDQVLVVDREGRILKNADRTFQIPDSVADVHTKNILRLFPQPQASELLAQIQESLSSRQTQIVDYYHIENGEERWYSGTISPFEQDKVVLVSKDITESIKTNSREREQKTLAEAIKNAASLVNSSLELNEVLSRVLASVGEVVSSDTANIMLLGERGRLSSLGRSTLSNGQKINDRLNQLSINDLQPLRTMKRSGRPLLIPDITLYPAWMDVLGENQIRSYLGTPIVVKGKVVGFLTLQSIQPNFYKQEHVDRLQSFIDLAGIAIENANLYRETQKLAISDELTGLYNRRGLIDLGRREVDRAKRFRHPLAVAIMDIDNFKQINDTYGHLAGDQLLNQVADCCRASFREIDIIARYGGDEIVVLLIENDVRQAQNTADRFRESIAKRAFKTDSGSLTATISIGVADIDDMTENLGQIIDKADRGLYLAKEAGRNRTVAV